MDSDCCKERAGGIRKRDDVIRGLGLGALGLGGTPLLMGI